MGVENLKEGSYISLRIMKNYVDYYDSMKGKEKLEENLDVLKKKKKCI